MVVKEFKPMLIQSNIKSSLVYNSLQILINKEVEFLWNDSLKEEKRVWRLECGIG